MAAFLSLLVLSFSRALLESLGECSVDFKSTHENESRDKGNEGKSEKNNSISVR